METCQQSKKLHLMLNQVHKKKEKRIQKKKVEIFPQSSEKEEDMKFRQELEKKLFSLKD